jgi:hypothetical protein
MAAEITIQSIAFDGVVAANQTVTVAHKLATAPDSTFVVDTTMQIVLPNGAFDPAYVISGLAYSTRYTIRVSNTCGDGMVAYMTLLTKENPCPDIARVFGTVY